MPSDELDECFEFVCKLVQQCGETFKQGFKNCGEVKNKGEEHDLVTIYDGNIERILMDGIAEKYPEHKFIAEEDSSASNRVNSLTSSPTWIIDPIDGTINFVKALHFTVISVAFVIDEKLEFGFLFNPILDEFFVARRGRGAFLNGERIFVNKQAGLRGSLIAHEISLGCMPWLRPSYVARTEKYLEKTIGIRAMGSAALTLGYVAKGTIDAYAIEYLKPWDIAAGALILIEAGGIVIDRNGGEINIMKPDVIAASSLSLALEIKSILDEIDAKLVAEGRSPEQLRNL